MASQVVPAAKRLRISHLLDVYGELLTAKQRTFMEHYFEEDMSFGEVAREYGVSRQAIFDSVKHGEETLERFESVLHLVENNPHGGAERPAAEAGLADGELDALAGRLDAVREQMLNGAACGNKVVILDEIGGIVEALRAKAGVGAVEAAAAPKIRPGKVARARG